MLLTPLLENSQQLIGAVIDVEEALTGAYTLEVSSPGLDRVFFNTAQMARYIGSVIAVRMHVAIDSRRKFKGVLLAVGEQAITLTVDEQDVQLPIADIEKANLTF